MILAVDGTVPAPPGCSASRVSPACLLTQKRSAGGGPQPRPLPRGGSGSLPVPPCGWLCPSLAQGTDCVRAASPPPTVDLITSSPQCLHSLVTWTHAHAGSCPSVPSLQSVLSSEYCGIIRAVWGCGDGHDYVMDTDSDCSTVLVDNALSVKREWNKSTAQRLTDNGAGADNAEAVSAPKPQHAPVRTTPCQQPANKGTASVPLNEENEPPQNRDSSRSQLDSTASLQEKALPQPVSPLSGATGKGFVLPSPSRPLGKGKEPESWPRERWWGWAPSSETAAPQERTQTPAGERRLPRESSLSLAEGKGEHGGFGRPRRTKRAGLLAPCSISPSDRGAETRPFRSRLRLAGETLLPCSCRGAYACRAVQNGRWFSGTTFARCFFPLKPNPVHMPARRGFPRAAAGDAEQQEPLLSAKESCRAGLLVGRVNVGSLLNSPLFWKWRVGINTDFELQKSGCV